MLPDGNIPLYHLSYPTDVFNISLRYEQMAKKNEQTGTKFLYQKVIGRLMLGWVARGGIINNFDKNNDLITP